MYLISEFLSTEFGFMVDSQVLKRSMRVSKELLRLSKFLITIRLKHESAARTYLAVLAQEHHCYASLDHRRHA